MDPDPVVEGERPAQLLPWRQLVLISVYWLGISAIWGAYEQFGQKQVELAVGSASVGTAMAFLELLGGIVAILVVPTVGTISDYTVSRWGRRKGYIISGAILDLVFLLGLAAIAIPEPADWDGAGLGTSAMLVAYVVCFLGLQFSSNLAQGPFQGYVPDLVPDQQVGVASGAMGIMRLAGQLFGTAVMLVGAATNQWGLPLVLIGLLEVALAAATFRWVREGPAARDRGGRSWTAVAKEAWGLDVLKERSFLRMTGVRLAFMAGVGVFVNISLLYVERSLGQSDPAARSTWQYAAIVVLAIGVAISTIPSGRLSDRLGRKPVIYGAIGLSAVGLAILALAPEPIWAMPGALILGLGSGAYLAVDWALMTDVIPLAASGRYMGLANIANSISGPVGLVVGGILMDLAWRAGNEPAGPRIAVLSGIVGLGIAAWLLRGVRPRRDPRQPAVTPAITLATGSDGR
jgi:MFS family permease